MRHDPDSSKVASAAVVPETPLSPSRRSDSPSDPQGSHPDRRRSPSPSSDSSSAESDCMANFIKRNYNTRIRKYFKWCRQVAINPHSASLGQVCDFFPAVFKEEGATAHSVRSCRTAVAAVHHGFGEGNTVSNSPAMQDLIKGMFSPASPNQVLGSIVGSPNSSSLPDRSPI